MSELGVGERTRAVQVGQAIELGDRICNGRGVTDGGSEAALDRRAQLVKGRLMLPCKHVEALVPRVTPNARRADINHDPPTANGH